jgi:BirA family biotin operon repressor/biotin-[acetyl-CoA-carboxylase] ligase
VGVAQEALELARDGAQTGEFVYRISDVQECAASGQDERSELTFDPASAPARPSSGEKPFEVATVVRLGVSMPYVPAVPYVVALGLCQFLRAKDEGFGIRWPYDICYKDQVVASIKATAGYQEGMFAVVSVVADVKTLSSAFDVADNTELLANKVSELVVQSVSVWEQQVKHARSFAGPIALILSDYFDMVPLLGQQVNKVYPSGNVALTARFGGIDVWGHAILVDQDGKEILVSEDEASVVPAV